jgi:hypothetical protein
MVEVMTVDDAKRRLGKQVYSYELMCLVDRVSASHSVILYVRRGYAFHETIPGQYRRTKEW